MTFRVFFFYFLLPSLFAELFIPEANFIQCNPSGDAFCEVKNVCISKQFGIFGIRHEPKNFKFPKVYVTPHHNDLSVSMNAVAISDINTDKVVYFPDTHLAVIGTYGRNHLIYQMVMTALPLFNLTRFHAMDFKKRHLLAIDDFLRKFAVPVDFLGYSEVFTGLPQKGNSANFKIYGEGGVDSLGNSTYCYSYATLGTNKKCGNCPMDTVSFPVYNAFRNHTLNYFGLPTGKFKKDLVLVVRRQSRAIRNINETVDLLKDLGFETRVVDFALLDFKAQVAAVADVGYFLAPHGNGNSHTLWLQPGAVFFEFFGPSKFGDTGYSWVADHKKLRYVRMDCPSPDCTKLIKPNDGRHEDMLADLPDLKKKILKVRAEINAEFFS